MQPSKKPAPTKPGGQPPQASGKKTSDHPGAKKTKRGNIGRLLRERMG